MPIGNMSGATPVSARDAGKFRECCAESRERPEGEIVLVIVFVDAYVRRRRLVVSIPPSRL